MPDREFLNQKHHCPRRNEYGTMFVHGSKPGETPDDWFMRGNDPCCTYCGSIHPDRMVEIIKEYGEMVLEKSTKHYKIYVKRPKIQNSDGGIKYYRHHDTPELVSILNSIYINQNKN